MNSTKLDAELKASREVKGGLENAKPNSLQRKAAGSLKVLLVQSDESLSGDNYSSATKA